MRLTARGRLAVALGVVLGAVGLGFANVAASLAALALFGALAAGIAMVPSLRISVDREVDKQRVVEGDSISETLQIQLHRGYAWVSVEEVGTRGLQNRDLPAMVRLSAASATTIRKQWHASEWGPQSIGPTRVRAWDPLRLIVAEASYDRTTAVRVAPRPSSLGRFSPHANAPQPALGLHSAQRPGDGADFFALRAYQPGDSVRRINWRASARSKDVVVNQVTRDTFARVVVILDLREKESWAPRDGTPASTCGGRAAASLLAHHDRMRDHLALFAIRATCERLVLDTNPRFEQLANELSVVEPGGSIELDQAIERIMPTIRRGALVYLITSGMMDEAASRAAKLLLVTGCRLTIISPDAPRDADDPESTTIAQESRQASLRAWRRSGATVVDLRSGSLLEVELLGS